MRYVITYTRKGQHHITTTADDCTSEQLIEQTRKLRNEGCLFVSFTKDIPKQRGGKK